MDDDIGDYTKVDGTYSEEDFEVELTANENRAQIMIDGSYRLDTPIFMEDRIEQKFGIDAIEGRTVKGMEDDMIVYNLDENVDERYLGAAEITLENGLELLYEHSRKDKGTYELNFAVKGQDEDALNEFSTWVNNLVDPFEL
jgi:hypothetical protein